jgi:hypothetical protein
MGRSRGDRGDATNAGLVVRTVDEGPVIAVGGELTERAEPRCRPFERSAAGPSEAYERPRSEVIKRSSVQRHTPLGGENSCSGFVSGPRVPPISFGTSRSTSRRPSLVRP